MSSAAVVICALRVNSFSANNKTVEFKESVDQAETAHYQPPNLYIPSLDFLCDIVKKKHHFQILHT